MNNSTEELYEENFIENVFYIVCESLLSITAIGGNGLIIYIFCSNKHLKRRTNYYIISLTLADLYLGFLGIPLALLLRSYHHFCVFTLSLLTVLFITSMFSILFLLVDRYWAIVCPIKYSKNTHIQITKSIISICWIVGLILGFSPLFLSNNDTIILNQCFFSPNLIVLMLFLLTLIPPLLLVIALTHIYFTRMDKVKEFVHTVTLKREIKITKNIAIIVLFFIICWAPLQTINCLLIYCPKIYINKTLINCCIILSHLNSACNPILYIYIFKDFRQTLKNMCGKLHKTKSADMIQLEIINNVNSNEKIEDNGEESQECVEIDNKGYTTANEILNNSSQLNVNYENELENAESNENIRDSLKYSSSEDNVSYEFAAENTTLSVPDISEIVLRIERQSKIVERENDRIK